MCFIDKLIEKVKTMNINSVAITDHGTLYGVIYFYRACKKAGIKPIIGLEAYVVPDMEEQEEVRTQIEKHKKVRKKMTAKELKSDENNITVKSFLNKKATEDKRYFGNSIVQIDKDQNISYKFGISHILLFAKNEEGYKNLIKIASESQTRGFYYKPRIDLDTLKKYSKGIIATSACRGGEIPRCILRGEIEIAEKIAKQYSEIFDNFYLEIQPSYNVEQRIINNALIEMSKKLNIPLIVTSDAHYVDKEDADIHEVLLAVNTGTSLEDESRLVFEDRVNYIMTREEMLEYGIPEIAIDNTFLLAEQCNLELNLDQQYLPRVETPFGYSKRQYIEKLCQDGLFQYFSNMNKEERDNKKFQDYVDRLKYELDIIEKKNFIDYFLICWDFIRYAKDNNILVGPGRGSAAGCVVSYTLGITDLDPIEHDLIFSRFLNPMRESLPDIDLDFEEYIDVPELFMSGRQKIIDYVIKKYGRNKICQILAMGSMGTRAVLKDVGRALSIDHNEINKINKFIPSESGAQWTLSDCLFGKEKQDKRPIPEIIEFSKKYPKLFQMALVFEGMPRHSGVHAGGVVISPMPVDELIPLFVGKSGEVVSQFDKDLLEDMGILKMDLLGLRTLGVIHKTIDKVKERYGVTINLKKINLNDQKTMNLIKSGDCLGVFQIESNGMRSMFKQMLDVKFDDIVVGLSLYRPGPMKFIPQYIECKNGYSDVQYLFPELIPILKSTHGIMVYQEQILRIAMDLAGYSEGDADLFRRAIGKKDEKLIEEQINILVYGQEGDEKKGLPYIPGLVKNGIPSDLGMKLGQDIVAFAKYAFNKSHAAGYAVLTVYTGYLKAHYPLEFMTYLISSYIGKDDEKIADYIQEARRMGIKILPPDVNKSEYEFTIEKNAIRFGLGAIKGLNKSAVEIMLKRKAIGKFKDLIDFIDGFSKMILNKKSLDVLALSGALNNLSKKEDRFEILKEIYELRKEKYDSSIVEIILEKYRDSESESSNKKKLHESVIKEITIDEMKILQIEQFLMGTYVSSHPLDGKAIPLDWEKVTYHGSSFETTGIIKRVKEIKTKKGDPMAFVSFETLEGEKDIVIFPKEFKVLAKKLEIGKIKTFFIDCLRERGSLNEYSFITKNIKNYSV